MEIADIIFDDEREGIVPVGTILADAAKRFGVDLGECLHPDEHSCEVVILKGAEQLSKRSVDEIGYFENSETDENRRLACFVKIVNVGEIKVMSAKNEKSADETNVKDSQD
ncbi:MAG: hypothetical protein ACRD6X_21450, partial [Pyrinomonadaceae bacterium]